MFIRLLKFKNNIVSNFVLLFLSILFLRGYPVPSINEFSYLLFLAKQWNPDYLLNDWTFSGFLPVHLVFNFVFGSLTLLFSLETVGWIGRILCWSLIIVALFKLGENFRLPLWMITLSIFVWLLCFHEGFSGCWIIGGFEAKCVAYTLFLFSLNGFIRGKVVLPAILLGLSFDFHMSVGLWGGVALGFTLLVLKYPIKKLGQFVFYATLAALPGLMISLLAISGNTFSSPEDLKFYVNFRVPAEVDPFSFSKRDIVVAFIFLLFNWLHFKNNQQDGKIRFMILFQLSLCLFFCLGFAFRVAEVYSFLISYPFRLFPLLVPLFFFLHLMHAYHHQSSIKLRTRLVAVGFLGLLSLNGDALGKIVDQARVNYTMWTKDADDLQKTFKWLAQNTPNGSIAILPPWRNDSAYLSQRAQIAQWKSPRFDNLKEWRERLEAMIGNDWGKRPEDNWSDKMEEPYNQLTEDQIGSIVKKYGGDYLVSKAGYAYPVLFDSGTYKVFSLKELSTPGSLSQFD